MFAVSAFRNASQLTLTSTCKCNNYNNHKLLVKKYDIPKTLTRMVNLQICPMIKDPKSVS